MLKINKILFIFIKELSKQLVENNKKFEQMSKSIEDFYSSLLEHKIYEIGEMKVEKNGFKSLFGQFKIVVKVK
jgi:hypothetical protein